ncbi:hypothetical protein PAHAL_9G320800 [Panicum hallii]|uniref:Uncharacterized protein n=1 Tax=Panicum hallii TaxID=206008 RepID=A0A2T8I359_9POAL|nr:hypothetical protein PAHAL_9G320800 [Panicum hallii]
MVTLPFDLFDFDDSDTQTEMDKSDNERRGYIIAVPRGPALRIFHRADGTFGCLVCPGLAHRWTRPNEVRDHIVGKVTSSSLRAKNKKMCSHHSILAQNEGWM